MDLEKIAEKIKEAKAKAKKRNFTQSVEASINFRNVNMQTTDKLDLQVLLPKGRGKDIEIGVFAEGEMNLNAKKFTKYVFNRADIERLAKNRREMRKIANKCYFFLAQADLMPIIGRNLGVVLGPRGKMPIPVPPTADLSQLVSRLKNTVRIRSKKNPTVNVPIGTENMDEKDLAENLMAVIDAIEKKIPMEKIESIYVKTTMGPAVKVM
ncbi:MAG TPA: 50S ribosomal protein L1 [Candidatus Altiarchaeales archaeon]|nr:MAG: 50S ribosomal protein L1 [Candidatus Altiarchaeales archaeon]HDN83806.1 50S ribosomal protein L1 [Candidatus Altiarchaeales archaeon]